MTTLASTRYGPGPLGPYIRVADITTTTNDFYAEGWADCTEVHLATTTSVVITGFFAVPGRISLVRLLHNVGTQDITLTANDVASEPANRLFGTDIILPPNTSVILIYDYLLLGWRAVAVPGGGTSGAAANRVITFTFQNSGVQLDANSFSAPLYIPFDCEILECFVFSFDISGTPVVGSIQLNIYKGTYSSYPPSTSIVAAAKPTLTSATKSHDATLTGWTKALTTGDITMAKVETVTGITAVSLILIVEPA